MPGSSDIEGEAHFAVTGPGVDDFAKAALLARTMQRALNAKPATPLTAAERMAVRRVIGLTLAGETDFDIATIAAINRANLKFEPQS
jgi:hypothetical protein